jgi:hypothetical protein
MYPTECKKKLADQAVNEWISECPSRVVLPIIHGNNGLDWCPQCIDTFDHLIEVVLDIILQYGLLIILVIFLLKRQAQNFSNLFIQ